MIGLRGRDSAHLPRTGQSTSWPGAAAPEPTRRLRVLMLIDKMFQGGGAERAMVALATHLPQDRFEIMVATTRPSAGPLIDAVRAAGIPHLALDRRHRYDLPPFRRLVTLLRDERIDVLHAHKFGSNLWGAILGRIARVPVVIAHEHSWSYEGEPVRRFLDGHVIGRLAHAFVAVSERDRQRMIDLEGVPPGKIVVLPNPYVPRSHESIDLRERLRIPPEAPVIGTIAVLRAEKALDVLIDAFAELSRSMPEARLVIAGGGAMQESLEEHARRVGMADRIHFLGWWEDVRGVLDALDVAALSSDREGAPLFAIECMAHRVPLVSTDVGNVGDLLADGEGVTLVPTRDPPAFAAALEALLRDPARRQAQAEAAAQRFRGFHVDEVAAQFSALYERLTAARAGRR
jgi:glycosyltransferase involved in cell wall biosynthesis